VLQLDLSGGLKSDEPDAPDAPPSPLPPLPPLHTIHSPSSPSPSGTPTTAAAAAFEHDAFAEASSPGVSMRGVKSMPMGGVGIGTDAESEGTVGRRPWDDCQVGGGGGYSGGEYSMQLHPPVYAPKHMDRSSVL